MKCDLCDQEFANSEEVKRHKEQMHLMGERNGETPDLAPDESEITEPAEQRKR